VLKVFAWLEYYLVVDGKLAHEARKGMFVKVFKI